MKQNGCIHLYALISRNTYVRRALTGNVSNSKEYFTVQIRKTALALFLSLLHSFVFASYPSHSSRSDIIRVTNEMGEACGMMRDRTGTLHTGFRWGNLREGDDLEGAVLDRRIKLKWIFKK